MSQKTSVANKIWYPPTECTANVWGCSAEEWRRRKKTLARLQRPPRALQCSQHKPKRP